MQAALAASGEQKSINEEIAKIGKSVKKLEDGLTGTFCLGYSTSTFAREKSPADRLTPFTPLTIFGSATTKQGSEFAGRPSHHARAQDYKSVCCKESP